MTIQCVRKQGGYVIGRFDLDAATLEGAIREACARANEFDLWEGRRRLYSHPCDANAANASGASPAERRRLS